MPLQEFLEERRRMLLIYNNLINEEHNVTDQHEFKSSVKSLSIRWTEVIRRSDELTPKYDKQYSAWLLFESELNSFRDQILFELEQRANEIVSTDAHKLFDLNKINALLSELRVGFVEASSRRIRLSLDCRDWTILFTITRRTTTACTSN